MNHSKDELEDLITLAKSHSTSSKLLEELSEICARGKWPCFGEVTLAVAIASNPNTPLHALEKLYREKEGIAGAPPATLDYSNWAWEHIELISSAIESNPNWPHGVTS